MAHPMIARDCLAYLSFDGFAEMMVNADVDQDSVQEVLEAHHLVAYSQYFLLHAADVPDQLDLQSKIKDFLDHATSWCSFWRQLASGTLNGPEGAYPDISCLILRDRSVFQGSREEHQYCGVMEPLGMVPDLRRRTSVEGSSHVEQQDIENDILTRRAAENFTYNRQRGQKGADKAAIAASLNAVVPEVRR
ncbi:hypothetical protein DFH08DRAFT_1000478 [Mycena albidolilacea]|uniref:Uncharacterized protein n=1 Tax=Mycena albidolilacea TaxID=1033008 RepID=A0AAD7A338_9AGAR|nr:hypothetical protein DFH08DRAFT_1000478 [Mycena albidolilacea]